MSINITDELRTDFLVYSEEVNNNRAFPSAIDGLKISQRACLWEMFDKGYSSNKPHVKSAKIDGGVLSNWHPHGSEYSTIVRMSQPWINNICEVDFHGANGSLLGGPDAAASRYTECRLSTASEDGLFEGIKKNTVDFIPNYSEDLKWPSVLPAIFPRLFVNGAQGIGYTIANEWEPGNLIEFTDKVKKYLKDKKVDCSDIFPDYPTGGIIINKSAIHEIYETGKGQVILRAKTEIVDNIIKITELPYQVYAEPLIQKIKDLVNSEQIDGIEDICNKSDDNGLLIEIECSDKADIILNKLFNLTDLQVSFNANQMALVDGVPKMLTLEDYIKVYIEHNLSCIKREYQFDLDKFTARKEIVDGLLKCLGMIDKVIETIKKSKTTDEAKNNLILEFGFTDNQAKAIIDMRLGKLANLEAKLLETEQIELDNEIRNCNDILSSTKGQKQILINRLTSFTKKYGWERRTQLADIDIVKEKAEVKKATKTTNEECIIALTKGNYIKRIPLVSYKPQTKILSEEERIIQTVKIGVKDKVILIGENGLMYKLQANKITQCNTNSTGTSLYDLLGTKILSIYSGQEDKKYLFMLTNEGLAKKIESEVVFNVSKSIGAPIMKLDDGDKIIQCYIINDGEIIELTVCGKIKKIETDKYMSHGRSSGGVKCIKLKGTQKIELF